MPPPGGGGGGHSGRRLIAGRCDRGIKNIDVTRAVFSKLEVSESNQFLLNTLI